MRKTHFTIQCALTEFILFVECQLGWVVHPLTAMKQTHTGTPDKRG